MDAGAGDALPQGDAHPGQGGSRRQGRIPYSPAYANAQTVDERLRELRLANRAKPIHLAMDDASSSPRDRLSELSN
jgi:hypothetical protein